MGFNVEFEWLLTEVDPDDISNMLKPDEGIEINVFSNVLEYVSFDRSVSTTEKRDARCNPTEEVSVLGIKSSARGKVYPTANGVTACRSLVS